MHSLKVCTLYAWLTLICLAQVSAERPRQTSQQNLNLIKEEPLTPQAKTQDAASLAYQTWTERRYGRNPYLYYPSRSWGVDTRLTPYSYYVTPYPFYQSSYPIYYSIYYPYSHRYAPAAYYYWYPYSYYHDIDW